MTLIPPLWLPAVPNMRPDGRRMDGISTRECACVCISKPQPKWIHGPLHGFYPRLCEHGSARGRLSQTGPGLHCRGGAFLKEREPDENWGQRGRTLHDPVMRLPSACDSRKVTRAPRHGTTDCDLRIQLPGLFRRHRLAKVRADLFRRARQRDYPQNAELGTWRHASAGEIKDPLACRCYGCTVSGGLFVGKFSR
jgi:hypothetical protein